VLAQNAVEHAIRLGLLLDVLDDRLDNQVAVLQVLEPGRSSQVPENFVLFLDGDLALLDTAGQELLDATHPFLQEPVLDFTDDRLVARRRAHLRDSRTHQPATQHAYRFDRHIAPDPRT
jgi:hypothetical protein